MSNEKYWACRKALKECGITMDLICGYKLYRYQTQRRYRLLDSVTGKIMVSDVTVYQIYNWLIKQGVIILD